MKSMSLEELKNHIQRLAEYIESGDDTTCRQELQDWNEFLNVYGEPPERVMFWHEDELEELAKNEIRRHIEYKSWVDPLTEYPFNMMGDYWEDLGGIFTDDPHWKTAEINGITWFYEAW